MTKHPLTDEICDQIQDSAHPCDPADMRAAADWQLEKVLEWMEECPNYDLNGESEHRMMIEHLKESMRPALQQENN